MRGRIRVKVRGRVSVRVRVRGLRDEAQLPTQPLEVERPEVMVRLGLGLGLSDLRSWLG